MPAGKIIWFLTVIQGIKIYKQSNFKLSNLAGQFWALTINTIPNYYYIYFMWDMLATSYFAIREEFTIQTVRAYVSERPPNAGQTIIGEKGHEITIATDVNKEAFYKYVLKQFRRD